MLQRYIEPVGAVLSGGSSTRMGMPKDELLLDGETLLERSVRRMLSVFGSALVVGASYEVGGAHTIQDVLPKMGPLSGIHAALARSEVCAVVACDMPFFSPELLRYMAQMDPDADVVVPKIGRFWEPLHAIYRRACLPYIEKMAKTETKNKKRPRVVDLYSCVRVRVVDEREISGFGSPDVLFFNINQPEDYKRALGMLIDLQG